MAKVEKVGAVIVAAGSSLRMGGEDKIFATLGNRPLLAVVVEAFQGCEAIDQIVLVLHKTSVEKGRKLVLRKEWPKVSDVCVGGPRRQDSVKNGLLCLKQCDWVVVHDGARPLVTGGLIERGLAAARETGAAIAAVPVTDTIKLGDENLIVLETMPRSNLWAAQTPQVFRFAIINEAYRKVKKDVTDDAALVEQTGGKVKLYMGSYDNIKVTTPGDLESARMSLRKRSK